MSLRAPCFRGAAISKEFGGDCFAQTARNDNSRLPDRPARLPALRSDGRGDQDRGGLLTCHCEPRVFGARQSPKSLVGIASPKPLAMTIRGCQIDQLVYQLYGLTDEEIKIVEGS